MAPDEKPGEEERNDVLSNLPRSRRQRPSARREEAKAARKASGAGKSGEGANGSGPKANGRAPASEASKPKAKPKAKAAAGGGPKPVEKVADSAERERPRKRVPASGYATVREPGSYGNADPDELLKSFVRSILRRLPG